MSDSSYVAFAMFGLFVFALGAAVGGRGGTATFTFGVGFGTIFAVALLDRSRRGAGS